MAPSIKENRAFIVAGTHSGSGKTTVTLALLRSIIQSGLSVQPFKIGPDFIDTAYHGEVAGRPSVNLDLWMMGEEKVKETFRLFSSKTDVALIEGMGALYDGENGTERGSAAFLSKLLGVPVILVIDVWGMTRSATPLLQGFLSFDRDVQFVGFILNRVGSERHAQMVKDALPPELKNKCLGHILFRRELEIPERHLGLVTVEENDTAATARVDALDAVQANIDISILLPRRRAYSNPETSPPSRISIDPVRIAIARDAAFCFYYAENLTMLEDAGAQLCPFSPVSDASLPAGIAGAYLGGGYPESFLTCLSSNVSLRTQLSELSEYGLPIYAECGGFMYLGRTLTDYDGSVGSMAGIFPIDTIMDREHLAIRYVSVKTLADSPLGPAGTEARGQEFHQSRIACGSPGYFYNVTTSSGESYLDGLRSKDSIGSYIHLHFGSNPNIPRHFVDVCRSWAQRYGRHLSPRRP
jgi:cobyrinic acid a,c-diamide synthase